MRTKFLNLYYELYQKRIDGVDLDDITFAELNEQIEDAKINYLRTLPIVDIARCPFTNELVKYRMDIEGFGPFWMYENPMREEVNGPDTFFGLDGSMARTNMETKEIMSLGPDRPFVIKELLDHPFIKAVIKEVTVAGNSTWLITYFSFPIADMDRPNLYGSDRYFAKTIGGEVAYRSHYTAEHYDYDIEKYLKLGKLFWIKKDDASMKLYNSIQDCPYLNIGGGK